MVCCQASIGTSGYGSVDYTYWISKYEVTNAQYAEFLDAVAAADANGLYNPAMGSNATFGGITRSGVSGSYRYDAKVGFENKPVVFVSFLDALRFANWLHNGQPSGPQDASTTEDGAYSFGTTTSIGRRHAGALVFLTSEDEWYKAAYYDAVSMSYFDHPAGADAPMDCVAPTADTGNAANCAGGPPLTDVGAYALSGSPYGTFDQGGNVSEWNEALTVDGRGIRGGNFFGVSSYPLLSARVRSATERVNEDEARGFRVATLVPEPGSGLLVLTGLLGLAAGCRRR